MRKVSGAVRRNIVGQFYSETILQSVFAVSIAVFLTILILPVFNSISGKELSLSYLGNWQFITGLVCVVIITGIISGSYPALFLSSFQPAQVLKGTYQSGLRGSAFRKTLVITQFTISVFLIIGTMIIYRQIDFMKTRDLGFNKNNLLYISMRSDTRKYFPTFKNELLKDTNIKGVTSGRLLPWRIGSNSGGARWQGKNPKETVLISFLKSGYDLCSTMGIDILSGREFSRDFSSDTSSAFLINEKLARIMGFRSPVGKRLSFLGVDGEIIGVMKDFHFLSLKREIGPLAIVLDPGLIRYAVIRINPENTSETLEYIEETWNNITSGYPFRYQFVEDNMANTYNIEERLGNILKYFTIIAVLIACLGLLGLASFTVEQRKKEIGIRKVLGASELKLIYIVCSEFFWLVLFSNLIAWPLSWLVMNNWIQEFAYRTDLGIEIFLLTGCIALVIALLTVSNQAVKAAFSDPAKTLKHE
ncbi:MAG: FtsX-like permease family protein [bacterium]|nr:FtsX-like permease family protein [bacterium]